MRHLSAAVHLDYVLQKSVADFRPHIGEVGAHSVAFLLNNWPVRMSTRNKPNITPSVEARERCPVLSRETKPISLRKVRTQSVIQRSLHRAR